MYILLILDNLSNIFTIYVFVCMVSKVTKTSNLEMVWKRAVVASPGVLSQDIPGSSEESHEKSQLRKPIPGPR